MVNRPKLSLKDPRFRGLLALGLVTLLALTLLWPLAVDRDARHLSAYSTGPEDLSRLHGELELTGAKIHSIFSTAHLLTDVDPTKSVLLIVGTERRYDPGEAQTVVDFLNAGGNVVLADETGFGSDVARAAGFAFSSQHVLDTVNYNGDPKLVVSNVALGDQNYRVVFNAPATVVALSNAASHDVLATSSQPKFPDGSFLDTNENGEIDIADQAGPFPLVVRTHVGAGTLMLVSDTGAFMNAQVGLAGYDNARFAHALVQSLLPAAGGTLLLDESRHEPAWSIAPWENGLRTLGRLTSGDVMPFLVIALLLGGSLAAWRLTRQTEDWSHHTFDASRMLPLPESLRPDLARAQRMARHRISERFNIPLEQVAAMTTEELVAATGDQTLAEAASGALRSDPGPLFRSFSSTESTP